MQHFCTAAGSRWTQNIDFLIILTTLLLQQHLLVPFDLGALVELATARMQQAQKKRNPVIETALSSHPSSWDDLADPCPNTDIGDGSCVMSHLGMRLKDGRWLAYEWQGDPHGVPVRCASFVAFIGPHFM